jgi:hypothetical protein
MMFTMKKIFLLIVLVVGFISAFSQSDDSTKYIYYRYTYGNRMPRFRTDSIQTIPRDTAHNANYGSVAIKNNLFYIKDSTKWTQASGDLSLLPYVTWENKSGFDSLALWRPTPKELRIKAIRINGATKVVTDTTIDYTVTPGFTNPMTTAGDIIYGLAAGAAQRLGAGTSTQTLHGGTVPSWGSVNLTLDVGGTLQIGNGGTGQGTANNALNALLPSQTSNSGKFLQTDGSNTSWQTSSGGMSNPLTTNGDIIYGVSTTPTRLGAGSSTQVLHSGSVPSWGALNLTNDVTGTLQNASLVSFKTYPPESQIGTIYEKDNFTEIDLAQDFTGFNGVVFSLNSGKIRCVSSTISWGTYGRFLPYRPTLLPKWNFVVEYTIVSAFGSNVGMGPAIRSNNVNGANFGYMSYLSSSSSTATPHLAKEDGTSDQTGTTFTITAGDKIRMVLDFDGTVMTLTAQNLTTSSAVSTVTKTFVATTAPYVPNTGTFGFSNFSGTYDISYLKISSTATKNPTLAVAADSKGQIFAGTFANRFPNLLNSNYPTSLNYSGAGDQLKDFMDKKIEVMSLNAEQWWIILGSNDLRYGSSLTTTLNRLANIDSWFKGTQTRVYYSVIPEDSTAGHAGIGLTAFKNYMASLYASKYIDLWTSFSTSNVLKALYNSGDDVHPNSTAHTDIAAAAVSSGLITTISPNRRTNFNIVDKDIALTGDAISLVPWGRNNVRRVDDSGRVAPTMIYHDVNKIIISPNLSQATAFSGALVTINGTFAMTGNSSALIVADRTTPANYYAGIVNNNEWRWTYNGTEIGPYIATDGRYKIGNGGTPETVIGTLNLNKSYTFVPGTQGSGGLALNIENATYTPSAGAFALTVGNFFGQPTLSGAAATFTDAVNVDIKGAPIAAGSVAFTNTPLSFRVQAGKSQFNAAVQIKDGTEGNGKVFTSDASGNGSWGSVLTTGSYTPTLTAVANVAASTSATCYYYRIGNEVTVYGRIQIDPTAATTLTQLGFSLPIASTFTTLSEAAGTFAFNNGEAGIIVSDAGNARAEFQFTPTTSSNSSYQFHFSYHVQ